MPFFAKPSAITLQTWWRYVAVLYKGWRCCHGETVRNLKWDGAPAAQWMCQGTIVVAPLFAFLPCQRRIAQAALPPGGLCAQRFVGTSFLLEEDIRRCCIAMMRMCAVLCKSSFK